MVQLVMGCRNSNGTQKSLRFREITPFESTDDKTITKIDVREEGTGGQLQV